MTPPKLAISMSITRDQVAKGTGMDLSDMSNNDWTAFNEKCKNLVEDYYREFIGEIRPDISGMKI